MSTRPKSNKEWISAHPARLSFHYYKRKLKRLPPENESERTVVLKHMESLLVLIEKEDLAYKEKKLKSYLTRIEDRLDGKEVVKEKAVIFESDSGEDLSIEDEIVL